MPLSFVPTPFTIVMMAIEMPAAIRPYSMAVAAVSSLRKARNFCIIPFIVRGRAQQAVNKAVGVVGWRAIFERRCFFTMSHLARVQITSGFVFGVAILLCGCIADQQKQLVSCETDASRNYPGKSWHGAFPSIEMAHFIQTCMRTAEYDFTCGPDDVSLRGSFACYRSSGKLGPWAYEIERWLRQL